MARRFTHERYYEVGAMLWDMNNRVRSLFVEISNNFGSSSKQAAAAQKALFAVEKLRSSLDDAVHRDFGSDPEVGRIFYPGPKP